ncbi:OB-fold nucleic acid binding domain-containing protein [Actinotalea sp. AC32]|nr:OB-fold nucleic acid binding domain-containing protein [Actinotalea sp. AC32]
MAASRGERLREVLRSATANRAEFEASQERRKAVRVGCTTVAAVQDRRRASVAGVLRSVTLRARENVPALEAELFDGTGSLRVVWLGQRRIAGIEPGRRARMEGLVCLSDGRPTMYNPRYELEGRHAG